jgi:hypothetical protein
MFGSSLYAMMFTVALVLEVAYRFDQFAWKALNVAPFVFTWVFITSLLGVAADRALTLKGKKSGLSISISIFLFAAAFLFFAVRRFLPPWPISEATFETYPAQAAYLKDAGSFLVLAFLFFLLPSHFVFVLTSLWMPQSANATKMRGESVIKAAARRALYPRLWVLCSLLVVFVIITIVGTAHLLDNLKPGPYHNLFVQLIYVRGILCFSFGLYCVFWYQRTISGANREVVSY